MKRTEFMSIMRGVAASWEDGDATVAAGFFDANAVYEEPPKQQFYRGQESILAFFRSVLNGNPPISMKWHNLAFDPKTNVGFGEYTFSRLNQFHGIVVLQFKGDKIYRWREYQYLSDLDWEDFAGESIFSSLD
ncbi:MAG: nuclear transport factor 2 family protein [Anaerolineales bacterium]|nr:nuclear transport factor 2 family protein [Anaerolineales bacterium]